MRNIYPADGGDNCNEDPAQAAENATHSIFISIIVVLSLTSTHVPAISL